MTEASKLAKSKTSEASGIQRIDTNINELRRNQMFKILALAVPGAVTILNNQGLMTAVHVIAIGIATGCLLRQFDIKRAHLLSARERLAQMINASEAPKELPEEPIAESGHNITTPVKGGNRMTSDEVAQALRNFNLRRIEEAVAEAQLRATPLGETEIKKRG